jgi:hypothetical protein
VGASVDVSSLVVRYGEAFWPFRLDLDNGSACIELDGAAYEISLLTWQAKMRLARFAHMDQAFVQARFLEACIRPPKILPADKRDEAVLLALANWLNVSAFPLDQDRLAAVTVDVCRALHVGPRALAALPASELEMLWLNLDRRLAGSEVPESSFSERPLQSFDRGRAPEPHFETKIVIVPDQSQSSDVAERDLVERDQAESDFNESMLPAAVDSSVSNNDESAPAVEAVADEQSVNELVGDELIVNEQITSNRKSIVPDRNATARFRVFLDKPPVKTSAKTANATVRLPLQRSRQATQAQVETADPKEFVTPSAPARNAKEEIANETVLSHRKSIAPDHNAAAGFRVVVDKPPVQTPAKTANATVRLPLNRSQQAAEAPAGETTLHQESEITLEHSNQHPNAVAPGSTSFLQSLEENRTGEIYPVLPRYGTDLTAGRDADRSAVATTRAVPSSVEAEWMFEEFCERLAEAAADLGIFEEV